MTKEVTGYLDSLTPEQRNTLVEVKRHVKQNALLEDRRAGDWNLLRFCRARNFDTQKVIEMIENFSKWFNAGFSEVGSADLRSYDKLRTLYGHGYHKTDKEGRPVYIEKVCELKTNEIFANYSDEDLTRYYIQSYERVINVILPECSRAAGRRIEQCINIFDLTGVNTFTMFVGKTKQFLNLALEIAQNYYPEILYKSFIINAGYLFSGIWMVVKGWLDPKTQAKIQIYAGAAKADLLKEIPAENLPHFLGGTSDGDLRADEGPWSEELENSRNSKTVFHRNPELVSEWYPDVTPEVAKSGQTEQQSE